MNIFYAIAIPPWIFICVTLAILYWRMMDNRYGDIANYPWWGFPAWMAYGCSVFAVFVSITIILCQKAFPGGPFG